MCMCTRDYEINLKQSFKTIINNKQIVYGNLYDKTYNYEVNACTCLPAQIQRC